MSMVRLEPPIGLATPRGKADAYFVIDYSSDGHLIWVCFIRETGESRSYTGPEVRLLDNETCRRGITTEKMIKHVSGKIKELMEELAIEQGAWVDPVSMETMFAKVAIDAVRELNPWLG